MFASAHLNQIAFPKIALVAISVVNNVTSLRMNNSSVHRFSAILPSWIAFLVFEFVSQIGTKKPLCRSSLKLVVLKYHVQRSLDPL
jgi:hypothetical protein